MPGVTLTVVTPPDCTEALAGVAAGLPDDVDVLAIVGSVNRDAVSAIYSDRGAPSLPAPRFGAGDLARPPPGHDARASTSSGEPEEVHAVALGRLIGPAERDRSVSHTQEESAWRSPPSSSARCRGR